jgi:ribonuclease Z
MLHLTILGNSAALPTHGRFTTAQYLSTDHNRFLIDAGEGVQMQLQRYRLSPHKINHILISHLHGDHYLGIFGLLSSMQLHSRQEPLNIFAPADLADLIRLNLKASGTVLNFPVHFSALPTDSTAVFYEDEAIQVAAIPMNHRIKPCNGFLFIEKPKKRNVLADHLPADTPFQVFIQLKNGEDVLHESGEMLYSVEDYTVLPPSYRFAHCSDTLFHEKIIDQISGVDLLYHEATFAQADIQKALQTHHSTALQAATIAQLAEVKKLLIGHFSSRYADFKALLSEAVSIFPNTYLAIEGETFSTE